jgi:ABC-type bacteriocin/lantibiotic exporter with double-glycine peptidase domain
MHTNPDDRAGRSERRMRACPAALALGILLAAGSGCRANLPAPPLSQSAVRLDLPLVKQDALYDCGLASISALCQYWGVEIPAQERVALARTAAAEAGLSGAELGSALERLGLETYLFEGSLDRSPTGIYGHIDAGRPLLVMLSADGTAHHYSLVLGYDEPRANLVLLDPMKGEILVPSSVFERNWRRCQGFTLLACRREGSAAAQLDPAHPGHTGSSEDPRALSTKESNP